MQPSAATQSRNMYDNTNPFASDLINSYAWDTAIVFIQNCTNTNYSKQTGLHSDSVSITGTTEDVQCNIYDMASNAYEWTTETSTSPCTFRGGSHNISNNYASSRHPDSSSRISPDIAFRTILYM